MAEGTTSEGLIELPASDSSQSPAARRPGALGWLVILWTSAVIVGTAVIDLVAPVERPKLKGLERQIDEKRRATATALDGSLARLIEYDYRLTSRVRGTLAQPYTDFLFHRLRETSSQVLIGSDDWLFLENRAHWPRGSGVRGIERVGALEAALTLRAREHGVRVLWMHIPRKAAIESEHLPRGVDPGLEFERQIAPMLRDRSVEVIDLVEPFLRMEAEPAYRKTDSHWSSFGRAVAALETARQSSLLAPEKERFGRLRRIANEGRHGAILNTLSVTATPELVALEPDQLLVVRPYRDGGAAAEIAVSGTSFTSRSLARLLDHFMGRQVQPFFNEGGSPYGKFGAIFGARLEDESDETVLPELLVIDVPNHVVMLEGRRAGTWSIQSHAAQWLADYPSTFTLGLQGFEDLRTKRFSAGTAVPLSGAASLASWAPGRLGHSGEGIVSVELEFTLEGGGATLLLHSPETALRIQLAAGEHQLVLPLIAPRAATLGGRVSLTPKEPGAAAVTVHGSSLVTTLRPSPAPAEEAPLIERFSACLVQTRQGGGGPRPVRVTVKSADASASQTFDFSAVRPGAPLLVAPGKLNGQRLGDVSLEALPAAVDSSSPAAPLEIETVQLLAPAK